MSDISTYKKRTIILTHDDNDCYHHVEELKRWNKYLVINAKKNHSEDLWEDEMDFNLETNPSHLWRPWFRLEDSVDTLQGATDEEYREILKKMIFDSGDSKEINKKKKIILTKRNEEDKEEGKARHWIKLTHPEDEIKLEKMCNDKKKDKRRNCLMKVGKLQDAFSQEDKTKKKTESNRKRSIRRQKTRRTFIKILHNITFNKEDHFGL